MSRTLFFGDCMLRAVRSWLTTLETTRDIESSILTSSHTLLLMMKPSLASLNK